MGDDQLLESYVAHPGFTEFINDAEDGGYVIPNDLLSAEICEGRRVSGLPVRRVDAVRYGWDSFMSMSPFNLHDAWRIHMPVKGYYDGSKRTGARRLVLAGLAGTEAIWPEFEALWKATLDEHKAPMHEDGIRRFHMADAMSLKHDFAEDKGWNCKRVRELIYALFNVMAQFKTKPLIARSCCVHIGKSRVDNRQSPEAVCCNFCIGGIRIPAEDQGKPKSVILYFDRSEGFLRKVDKAWRSLPESKRKGWARQVRAIVKADSSSYPIQASDIIGWLAGNKDLDSKVKCGRDISPNVLWQSTFIALDHDHKAFSENENGHYSELP